MGKTYTVSSGNFRSLVCATSNSLFMLTAAPQQEKASCVLRFEVSRSVITVQHEFRARFRKDAPHRNNITRSYRQFVGTGCLCKGKSSGRPRVSNDKVERVRKAFQRSPRKSLGRASRELDLPKITVTVTAANGVRFAHVR